MPSSKSTRWSLSDGIARLVGERRLRLRRWAAVHLFRQDLACSDHLRVIEKDAAPCHRDVEVTGAVVRTAELPVRTGGEQHAPVVGAGLHPHHRIVFDRAPPAGTLVETP